MLHGVGNCTFDAYTKVMVNVVRNFLSSTEPIFAGFSCGVTKGVKWLSVVDCLLLYLL